jgi:hypothetical protein
MQLSNLFCRWDSPNISITKHTTCHSLEYYRIEASSSTGTHTEGANSAVTHTEAAHTQRYTLHASRSTTHRASTHAELTHQRSPFVSKSSRSKDSKSKVQLSNFCCRPDSPIISTINILHGTDVPLVNIIMQNKPNLNISIFMLTSFIINGYLPPDTWYGGKNKPNTNPIQTQYKPISKPIQTHSKPIRTYKTRLVKKSPFDKCITAERNNFLTSLGAFNRLWPLCVCPELGVCELFEFRFLKKEILDGNKGCN